MNIIIYASRKSTSAQWKQLQQKKVQTKRDANVDDDDDDGAANEWRGNFEFKSLLNIWLSIQLGENTRVYNVCVVRIKRNQRKKSREHR